MTLLWHYFTLILQWFAEPQGCDELDLHQADVHGTALTVPSRKA